MALFGQVMLILALAAGGLSTISLLVGYFSGRSKVASGEKFTNAGYLLTFATTLFLTIAIALLLYCFFAGNYSILYVAENHSTNTTALSWLFKVAGLWGGSQGSLLFWAWLISLFASYVAYRRMTETDELSSVALAIMQLVLVAFMCVLAFSTNNNPFQATPAAYLNADGSLNAMASGWGMNVLLEHWAMAIHPPALFIGYAGFTVPFAYAVAALIVNDPSKRWVELCSSATVFSWFFLGAGIGLGAVWAYVVLGWGGYWGWDAVENASLLSWLVGVALIHSFTIYRKRGGFKRWAVICACLAFSFVILGTFITRSGIVESVHAFEGDMVSLVFFLALIVLSLLAGIVGIIVRRKSFEASEEIESLTSKNTAYYFNNVIMLVSAFVVAYLTVSSALPSWLPFGGQVLSAGTYNAIARPIGTLYFMLMAVCPLLVWQKTEGKEFRARIKGPFIAALVIFIGFVAVFITHLYPNYADIIAAGGTAATGLSAEGPSWYYNGLALLALFTSAALFCNTFYLFVKGVSARRHNKGEGFLAAVLHLFTKSPAQSGGYLTHLGMAIMLAGLVGSSMYVAETAENIDSAIGTQFSCEGYTLELESFDSESLSSGNQTDTATFLVYDEKGEELGEVTPSMTVVSSTQQSKLNASVMSFFLEDLFVVYQGVNDDGTLSMDVRVNPLISWVWVGFAIMLVGSVIACTAKREKKKLPSDVDDSEGKKGGEKE